MAIDFPNSPTNGQTVTVGSSVYTYNSSKGVWNLSSTVAYALAADNEVIPLDDLYSKFDGIQNRFLPTYQGTTVSVTNPLKLLVSIDGVQQKVNFPEYVWQSPISKNGLWLDSSGYIAFLGIPPVGSTFDGRILAGPSTTTRTNIYPFSATDILLGA